MEFIDNSLFEVVQIKNNNSIRIMTYNVHGFKNKENVNKYNEIMTIITQINPNILILQEIFIFKKDENVKQKNIIDHLTYFGYVSIFFTPKGDNMIASKIKITNNYSIDLGKDHIVKVSRGANISFYDDLKLIIIGTHLDVFDETGQTRIKQINKILTEVSNLNKNNYSIILTGDLNSLRKSDYNNNEWKIIKEIDKKRNVNTIEDCVGVIEENNFIDSFYYCKIKSPIVSVWSNRRVDYIFGKNINFISSSLYKTIVSDHYPLYADFIY